MSIEGKVAFVTGGSHGLGMSHCLTLARAGCNVALTGFTHMDGAEDVARQITGMGKKSLAINLDVVDPAAVNEAVDKIEKELGPVEILVNNAASGIVRAVTIHKMDKADWDHDLEVNLTGPFNTIRRILPGMMERGWGRIINVSSITGTMGGAGQCSYAATKAGLIGLTKAIALESARKGVTCNAVVLGSINGGAFHTVAPEFQERIVRAIAMRRPGAMQEVSNVIAFLASEESSYMTGEAVEISGGAGLFTF
ncbi:MAG: SDR family oxidoreductase [Dehalococcoidales bacterium]|nr:SDR family oxidoreductase [Dehalococcoidales bacterium]